MKDEKKKKPDPVIFFKEKKINLKKFFFHVQKRNNLNFAHVKFFFSGLEEKPYPIPRKVYGRSLTY